MNNLDIYDDFKQTLKEAFPDIMLDGRDEFLIGMAINHTCLCLYHKKKEEADQ